MRSTMKVVKSQSEPFLDTQLMQTMYNKTMTYLKKSQYTADIKKVDEVLSDVSYE